MTIYLYVKTHSITGLKYLGKTKQNPYKYLGSGVDWISHLEKYGTSMTTEIIKECQTNEELSLWGRYYSKLYSVVTAMDDFGNKIWANRIPETGGSDGSSLKGRTQSSETVATRVQKNTGKKRSTEFKQNRTGEKNHFYGCKHSEDTRKTMRENHADVSEENNPMYGKKGKDSPTYGKTWGWSEESRRKFSGENNPMYGKPASNRGKTPEKFTCQYCGACVSKGNLSRWHNDNCKSKENT